MKDRFYTQYGPWAVVTGASSGIGCEIARCLAKRGLNLVLVARRQGLLEQIANDIKAQYSVNARILVCDLGGTGASEQIAADTQDLDVGLLVAAAGFGTSGLFLEANLEQELNMIQVNCNALVSLCWYFGRRFARRRKGGIILMSSLVAFQGVPNAAHYAATKAYVQSFAEALQVELGPIGIDVLASAPGPVRSGFATRADMRMGGLSLTPADVAEPTVRALGRKLTVRPGFISKLIPYSMVVLPRWIRARLVGTVMKGMTKHQPGYQKSYR